MIFIQSKSLIKKSHSKSFRISKPAFQKKITFDEVGRNLYAFTAEGDPKSGIIGDKGDVVIIQAQVPPRLADKGTKNVHRC